ncbi:hypothetical protein ACHAXR_010862 [Thalassiosira sp. AJA248-18]
MGSNNMNILKTLLISLILQLSQIITNADSNLAYSNSITKPDQTPGPRMSKDIILINSKTAKTLGPCSKRSKRLRFSVKSLLILTEPRDKDLWYTRQDMTRFKMNARRISLAHRETRTANLMDNIALSAATGLPHADIHINGSEHIRGIEHLISPQVSKFLIVKRRKTITAVLQEQQAQKKAGMGLDPSRTAQVSEANSSFSKEWCSRITNFQNEHA